MAEPIKFGRYLLVKKLASGGMAQVWLARQSGIQGFEKLLVIKQVLPHLAGDDSFITMFLDEARLAAHLNHPNVVQVFDLGQEDESLYIAMEYIHGEDLRRLDRESRKAGKPIPIPLVCRIVADAAAGLHYAHTLTTQKGSPMGIVHRDVSPQNIMVTFEGGVKVLDFGIAKAANRANSTSAGVLKGKYSYMSPEQAAAKPLDARTDVFALGILLHELLTGRRLFKRDSDIATLHAVVSSEIPAPGKINPVVPPKLDPIVMSALERDPEYRIPDAGELQLELESFLIEQKVPTSSAHLRAYMQDLFSKRLAIEKKRGGPSGYLLQRATGSARSVGFDKIEAEGPGFADIPDKPDIPDKKDPKDENPVSPEIFSEDSRIIPPPSDNISQNEIAEQEDSEKTPPESIINPESSPTQPDEKKSPETIRALFNKKRDLMMAISGLLIGLFLVAGVLLIFKSPETGSDATILKEDKTIPEKSLPEKIEPEKTVTETITQTEEEKYGSPEEKIHSPDETGAMLPVKTPEIFKEKTKIRPPAEKKQAARPRQERGTLNIDISPPHSRVDIREENTWRRVERSTASLPPGRYPIRITLPDGAVHKDNVNIQIGRTKTYRRSFATGTLRVVIHPFGSGGEIIIRGRAAGSIPGPPVTLYEGMHDVTITSSDGRSVQRRVNIPAKGQTSLTVEFN